MTTITQSITSIAPAANPATMTKEVFSTTAAANVISIVAMTPEINTWAGQANTVAGEVNANAATATTQAGIATTQASNAAASAASALTAPGTSATSTTSLLIEAGSKIFTIQTGKAFTLGQTLIAASNANPAVDYMWGAITAHNSGTGSLTISVAVAGGSGTHTDWTIGLSSNPAASAAIITAGAYQITYSLYGGL